MPTRVSTLFRTAYWAVAFLFLLGAQAATVSWKAPVSGAWADGVNWSTGTPPGALDKVVIDTPGFYTVTANGLIQVGSVQLGGNQGRQTLELQTGSLVCTGASTVGTNGIFNLAGGEVAGPATWTIDGTFNWSGGGMNGTGRTTFSPGSVVTVLGGVQKSHFGRTIENRTTVLWRDQGGTVVGFGASWINAAGSVVDLQTLPSVDYGGGVPAVFLNQGTWKRSGTSALVGRWDYLMVNQGVVSVETGVVQFRQGGDLGGTWRAETNGTVAWTAGVFTNRAGTTLAGPGLFQVAGASFQVDVDQSTTVRFELAGGEVRGGGRLTLNGVFDWTGGQMRGDGSTLFGAGSAVTVKGAGPKAHMSRTIENRSTVVWRDEGGLQAGLGARWTNAPGSVFDMQFTPSMLYGGGDSPRFFNRGVFKRTGGATVVGFCDYAVFNEGSVSVESGVLQFRGGGSVGGSWTVQGGATATFTTGVFSNQVGATLTGTGLFKVDGGTFRADADMTTGSRFELASGEIAGRKELVFKGVFDWNGGGMRGEGRTVFDAGGSLNIQGTTPKVHDARTLESRSAVTWRQQSDFWIRSGARWVNGPGGVVDVQLLPGVLYTGGDPGVFLNQGTLKFTGNANPLGYWDYQMVNEGLLSQEADVVELRYGGAAGGSWSVAANRTLVWKGGVVTNRPLAEFKGAGLYQIGGSAFHVTANQATAARFELAGGELSGDQTITFTGAFDWTGGDMRGGGKTIFGKGCAVAVKGVGQKGHFARTIENQATVAWRDEGGMVAGLGGRWINAADGVVDAQLAPVILYGGGSVATFLNQGVFKRTGAASPAGLCDFAFLNEGTVSIESGVVQFRRGGSAGAIWKTAAGGVASWAGGVFSNRADLTLTGAGLFQVAGGIFRFDSDLATPAHLGLAGGEWRGTGAVTLSGKFDWTGGQMRDVGKTVFAAGSTVTVQGTGQKAHFERSIENRTTVAWRDEGGVLAGFGAQWLNKTGSVVDMQRAPSVSYAGGVTPAFINQGVLLRSGPDAAAGFVDYALSNAGEVRLESGRVTFRTEYRQTAGKTVLAGGHLDGTLPLDFPGGSLEGAGEIGPGVAMGGSLLPGRSVGRLTVLGSISNAPTSGNWIQIGGLTPGAQHDQVNATSVVSVGGALNIELVNDFEPAASDAFVIFTGASRVGTFQSTNPPVGFAMTVQYNPANVTVKLVRTNGAPPLITQQPKDVLVAPGQSATLSVVAAGTGLGYQWFKDGTAIPGATQSSFTQAGMALRHVGTYRVAVKNSTGTTTSSPAKMLIPLPPLNTAIAESYNATDGCVIYFVGVPGNNYVLQGTRSLTPAVQWTRLSTNQMPEILMRVTDPAAVQFPYRFYRFIAWP